MHCTCDARLSPGLACAHVLARVLGCSERIARCVFRFRRSAASSGIFVPHPARIRRRRAPCCLGDLVVPTLSTPLRIEQGLLFDSAALRSSTERLDLPGVRRLAEVVDTEEFNHHRFAHDRHELDHLLLLCSFRFACRTRSARRRQRRATATPSADAAAATAVDPDADTAALEPPTTVL